MKTAPARSAVKPRSLFNRLLRPNTDLAIEFPHRDHRSRTRAAFNIGRQVRARRTKRIDRSVSGPADLGQRHLRRRVGECTSSTAGIPCFMPEIGAARRLDHELIAPLCRRRAELPQALWRHSGNDRPHGGGCGRLSSATAPFRGSRPTEVSWSSLVKLHDKVVTGQKIAVQRNSFWRGCGGIYLRRGRPCRRPAQRCDDRTRHRVHFYTLQPRAG